MKIPMKLILLKIFQVVLFLCTVPAWGADFIPAITNYTVKDYQGAHQNWACAQGDDGVIPLVCFRWEGGHLHES